MNLRGYLKLIFFGTPLSARLRDSKTDWSRLSAQHCLDVGAADGFSIALTPVPLRAAGAAYSFNGSHPGSITKTQKLHKQKPIRRVRPTLPVPIPMANPAISRRKQ